VIPEDWKVEPLKSITSIKTGPFGTLLKADEYSSGEGTPLISVGEVGEGMLRVDDHTPLVPPSVVRRLPEYVLNCGDIVLGRKGAVDRSALVSENQAGWFLGSDGIRIRPSKSCYPPFVAWQFQRNAIKAWLLQNATGTTMASMNQEILKRVFLPIPPLPEQRAIAAALSDVDALLTKLDALIAKKRDVKQAAMQQLLTGKQRLPGLRHGSKKGDWACGADAELERDILTLLVEGHANYRGIRRCLRQVGRRQVSLGTISAVVQEAERRARALVARLAPPQERAVALDEIYGRDRRGA